VNGLVRELLFKFELEAAPAVCLKKESTMSNAKNDDQQDFEQFMRERADAAQSYVNGDAAPVLALLSRELPSTFFGPGGGYTEGADAVASTHGKGAQSFQPGGDNALEFLQVFASDGVGYWVGIQHARVHLPDKAKAVPMDLRVTEVFRREDGAWRLVHRHADMLVEASHAR
jgi:ketosteroid isomerase-like protein